MPTILRFGPYRFYFFAYDCRERRHVHVDHDNFSAKFWLDPQIALAHNHGFSNRELRDIERVIQNNLETLRNEWDSFCNPDDTSA